MARNPDTYRRMSEDMDIDAVRVLEGDADLDQIADEIVALVKMTVTGAQTKSEELGHQEFILTYKTFDQAGPICLPRSAQPH